MNSKSLPSAYPAKKWPSRPGSTPAAPTAVLGALRAVDAGDDTTAAGAAGADGVVTVAGAVTGVDDAVTDAADSTREVDATGAAARQWQPLSRTIVAQHKGKLRLDGGLMGNREKASPRPGGPERKR
jgi:hypothetical protein